MNKVINITIFILTCAVMMLFGIMINNFVEQYYENNSSITLNINKGVYYSIDDVAKICNISSDNILYAIEILHIKVKTIYHYDNQGTQEYTSVILGYDIDKIQNNLDNPKLLLFRIEELEKSIKIQQSQYSLREKMSQIKNIIRQSTRDDKKLNIL